MPGRPEEPVQWLQTHERSSSAAPKEMRYKTIRKGHLWEFRNKVRESGTGELASLTCSPMVVGLLVGREHQRRNRLPLELITKDTREKTTKQAPEDKAKQPLPQ